MNFWMYFEYLCKIHNIKPNQVGKILNISSASITGWKQGSPPNSERLVAIADYFDVSTDFLLGRSSSDPELSEDEKLLLQNYRRSDERGKRRIQGIAEEEAKEQDI